MGKIVWTKVDLFLNWQEKQISIFLDEVEKENDKVNFYYKRDQCDSVDYVQVYNLKPGTTSMFRDIKVCEKCCDTSFCAACSARFNLALFLGIVMYYIEN